jgi:hypothetical protein
MIAPGSAAIRSSSFAKNLQLSSTICTIAGGIMLASNTTASAYGFVLLALGSSQLFACAKLTSDRALMMYAGSLFLFVDCLGMYRWLVK